jgi:chromosome segregation ATPase
MSDPQNESDRLSVEAMTGDKRKRLDALLERRDQVRENVQRIKGRLDSARSDKTTIEDECKRRGVEPDQLDSVIGQLSNRFEDAVGELEIQIRDAESAVAPYLEE